MCLFGSKQSIYPHWIIHNGAEPASERLLRTPIVKGHGLEDYDPVC